MQEPASSRRNKSAPKSIDASARRTRRATKPASARPGSAKPRTALAKPEAPSLADAQAQQRVFMRRQGLPLLRGAGGLALQAVALPQSAARLAGAFMPLTRLLARQQHIDADELGREIDSIFNALYQHPLTGQARRFTSYLRTQNMLPRAHLLGQLMSNTQHLGLVVRSEYLHLSRSAAAMLGTLGTLYQGVPCRRVVADVLWALNSFPARALHDALRGKTSGLRHSAAGLASVFGPRRATPLPTSGGFAVT